MHSTQMLKLAFPAVNLTEQLIFMLSLYISANFATRTPAFYLIRQYGKVKGTAFVA